MAADTLAVFDLDGTLTRGNTFLAFFWHCLYRRPGMFSRILPLPLAVLAYFRGRIPNSHLKERFLLALLQGERVAAVDGLAREFSTRLFSTGLRLPVMERLRQHQREGHRVLLATASPECYVPEVAETLGISEIVCTRLARLADDTYSGRLAGGNCYGAEKLAQICSYLGPVRPRRVIAYSDHHSDWPLLAWADQSVLVHPCRRLQRLAGGRSWETIA